MATLGNDLDSALTPIEAIAVVHRDNIIGGKPIADKAGANLIIKLAGYLRDGLK